MTGVPKALRAAARRKAAWAKARAVSGLQYWGGSCSQGGSAQGGWWWWWWLGGAVGGIWVGFLRCS